jgi:hypothetical protein
MLILLYHDWLLLNVRKWFKIGAIIGWQKYGPSALPLMMSIASSELMGEIELETLHHSTEVL